MPSIKDLEGDNDINPGKEAIVKSYNAWRDSVIQNTWESVVEVATSAFGKGFFAFALAAVALPALAGAVGLTGGGALVGLATGINFLASAGGFAIASTVGALNTGLELKRESDEKTEILQRAALREAEKEQEKAKALEKALEMQKGMSKPQEMAPAQPPHPAPAPQEKAPAAAPATHTNVMTQPPAAHEQGEFTRRLAGARKTAEISHLEDVLRRRSAKTNEPAQVV